MKKIVGICLALILMFGNTFAVFANDLTKEEYLISKGLPSSYVYSLSEVQLEYIHAAVYGQDKKVLSFDIQEIYETQENGVETRGTIPATTMELSIIPIADCTTVNGQDRIDKVTLVFTYTWLTKPKIKWTDAMAVNWDYSVFSYIPNSFQITCYGRENGGFDDYYSSTVPNKLVQGGIGFDIPLTWGGYDTYEGMGSIELVAANGPLYQATGYLTTNINVEYCHDINLLSQGFTYEGAYFVGIASNAQFDSSAASVLVSYKKD